MIYWKRPKKRHKKVKGGKQLIGATFQVEKFNNEGNVTYKGPVFNNLVLTVGLDLWHDMGYSLFWAMRWCNVGTDATDPAIGQSGLLAYLASSNNDIAMNRTYEAAAPAHVTLKKTYEFEIGTVTGNLREVGLSRNSNSDYFNRQLFRDEYGDPTTITVLENEGIRVIAELFVYSDMQGGDVETGSFVFNGEALGFEKRFNIGSEEGFTESREERRLFSTFGWDQSHPQIWISSNNSPNEFLVGSTGNRTYGSYTAGSCEKEVQSVYPAGSFVGDINKIVTGWQDPSQSRRRARYYEFLLDAPIEVTDVEEVTFSVESSWGRWEGYS